jgi:hypothetical protein
LSHVASFTPAGRYTAQLVQLIVDPHLPEADSLLVGGIGEGMPKLSVQSASRHTGSVASDVMQNRKTTR